MFVDGCMHLKVLTLRSKEVPRKAWAGYADLWIIHVSSSLKVIGGDAFRGVAQLTMLDLTVVTSMGERTFEEYSSLVEVTLGDGITCIGGTALDGTIVGRVAVLAKLPDAFVDIFDRPIVAEASLALSTSTIPVSFLKDCQSVETPSRHAVTEIGSYAFQNCTNLNKISVGCW